LPTNGVRRNRLLASLPADLLTRFKARLEPIDLKSGDVLFEPDEPIAHVYFPVNAVVSLLAIMTDGNAGEVATVGNEGMVGVPIFLGTESMPVQSITQVAGAAYRMRGDDFLNEARGEGVLHDLLHRYTQALLTQVAQSAVCNRLHPMEERAARWLLMTHDRVGASEVRLTHEFLAAMLGVRRATVSVAAGLLERAGLIEQRCGVIRIVDRPGLETASCGCYFIIKAEYERLLGGQPGPRSR